MVHVADAPSTLVYLHGLGWMLYLHHAGFDEPLIEHPTWPHCDTAVP